MIGTPATVCPEWSVAGAGGGGQQPDQVGLVEVAGPAERGGVEPGVLDVRVGAQVEQRSGQLQVAAGGGVVQGGLPRLLDRGVAAATGVDVEAQLGEQRDRLG